MGVSLKADVLPGSAISSASALALGETTSTYGIAEACALWRSLVSALSREYSPKTIAKAVHAVRMAVIAIARLLNARPGLFGPGSFRASSVATARFFVSVVMARAFPFLVGLILNTLKSLQFLISRLLPIQP